MRCVKFSMRYERTVSFWILLISIMPRIRNEIALYWHGDVFTRLRFGCELLTEWLYCRFQRTLP